MGEKEVLAVERRVEKERRDDSGLPEKERREGKSEKKKKRKKRRRKSLDERKLVFVDPLIPQHLEHPSPLHSTAGPPSQPFEVGEKEETGKEGKR